MNEPKTQFTSSTIMC